MLGSEDSHAAGSWTDTEDAVVHHLRARFCDRVRSLHPARSHLQTQPRAFGVDGRSLHTWGSLHIFLLRMGVRGAGLWYACADRSYKISRCQRPAPLCAQSHVYRCAAGNSWTSGAVRCASRCGVRMSVRSGCAHFCASLRRTHAAQAIRGIVRTIFTHRAALDSAISEVTLYVFSACV